MHASPDEKTLEQVTAEFPGWRVWRPRGRDDRPSSWAATRLDESAGTDPTVIADTAEQLRHLLADQRELVERTGRIPLDLEAFPGDDAP